jgi:hypothetical protein
MNPYDRIEVKIAGQMLSARPIVFTYKGDEIVGVEKYETTCPSCGCMIHFGTGITETGCKECGAGGAIKAPIPKDELSIAVVGQIFERNEIPPEVTPVDRGCPFVDPIELGIFSI